MWPSERCGCPSAERFNPHTYMRCDLLSGSFLLAVKTFQSTHLHEVWPVNDALETCKLLFQSTHLHEVWLSYPEYVVVTGNVSIHTPTWGVTSISLPSSLPAVVSIHTPTWGVTSGTLDHRGAIRSFNPHTYMRCDYPELYNGKKMLVSIHTPTWGVTLISKLE